MLNSTSSISSYTRCLYIPTRASSALFSQTIAHAEAEATQKAVDAGISGTAKKADLFIDRDPCDACGKNGGLRSLARNLGVDELAVHSPSGTTIVKPTKYDMTSITLTESKWTAGRRIDSEQHNPKLEELSAALGRMNGRDANSVCVSRGDDTSIVVGGSDGQYVVSFFINSDGDSYTLANPNGDASSSVLLTAGGQAGRYPGNKVVDHESVLRAVLRSAEKGERDEQATWIAEF